MAKFIGVAGVTNLDDVKKDYQNLLIEGEYMEVAFKTVRDVNIFTNYRIIFVDRQGITGKKTEFFSVPYAKISAFAIESAGMLDIDVDVKIWVEGLGMIIKSFGRKVDAAEVQRIIFSYVQRCQK
mmetsp:Transcript_3490/g.6201  ORF Transcript_3490/g.6201 Transcript_3490/m.6201 type:complete len:125 (+) Transcript_3490:72-446(+)